MAHRVCEKCKAAENPLGRLRFKKSRIDGKVYCENCDPLTAEAKSAAEAALVEARVPSRPTRSSSSGPAPSAGLVVIPCPDCRNAPPASGGITIQCQTCAGYGSVRIEANMLNVYRPEPIPAPKMLLED